MNNKQNNNNRDKIFIFYFFEPETLVLRISEGNSGIT